MAAARHSVPAHAARAERSDRGPVPSRIFGSSRADCLSPSRSPSAAKAVVTSGGSYCRRETPKRDPRPCVRCWTMGKKVWLLDQYGVLHDGANAYPAAIEPTRGLHPRRQALHPSLPPRSGKTLQSASASGYDVAWFSATAASRRARSSAGRRRALRRARRERRRPSSRGPRRTNASTPPSPPSATEEPPPRQRGRYGPTRIDRRRRGQAEPQDGTETVNGAGTSDAERAEGAEDVPIERMRTILERAASRGLLSSSPSRHRRRRGAEVDQVVRRSVRSPGRVVREHAPVTAPSTSWVNPRR